MNRSPLLWQFTRALALFSIYAALALISAWRHPDFPQPAPKGYGVVVAPEFADANELNQLGSMWYYDYGFNGLAYAGHLRLLSARSGADLEAVRRAARTNPGAWWQFGNEPNDPNQDNLSPTEYSRHYHDFYFGLKSIDPQARVVPAGIADASWEWARDFREAYREGFGDYPPEDGWSIHNYLLDSCEGAVDVGNFQFRILRFREWLTEIGEGQKPLFLTEYGVLYGNGCCSCPPLPKAQLLRFLETTSSWLQNSRPVDAWAWFALDTHGQFNGDLAVNSAVLTPLGEAYRELVGRAPTQP